MLHKLRWLVLVCTYLFRTNKKLPPTSPVEVTFRVLPSDVEWTRLYSHSYFSFMALGRWEFILRTIDLKRAFKEKWSALSAVETIVYKKSVRLFSKVTVKTTMVDWDEKWLYFHQDFFCNEEHVARGLIRGLFRGANGNIKPTDSFSKPLDGSPPRVLSHESIWVDLPRLSK
jgi:acyl-CoA thioesterase FadM